MSNGALTPIPDLTDPRSYTGYPALQGLPPAAIAQAPATAPAIAQSTTPAGPAIAQPSGIQQPTAPQGSTEWQQQRQQTLDQQAFERTQRIQDQFERAQLKPWQDLGTGGKIARVAETIGGVMFPGYVSRIPGSPINMALRQQEAEKELDTAEQLQNQQMEARARMIAAEQGKHQLVTTPQGTFSVAYDQTTGQPTVSELKTPAGLPMYPAGKTTEEQAYDYYMHGGPGGGPRLDPKGQPYDPMTVIEGVTGAKLGDDRKQAMNAYKQANPGANDYQAFVATEPQKQGTQSEQLVDQYFKDNPNVPRNFENESRVAGQVSDLLQKMPQQNILVPNAQGGYDVQVARPGMTLPANFQTFTGETSTQKGIQGAKAAQAYADAYMKRGQFTGAGDEALMEQYFELAKPDSGFRMSQPQIEMLIQARSIMGSMAARARHWFTPSAPWFSDEQRRQIVETMGMIEESKVAARGGTAGGAGAGAPAGGQGMKYQKGDQFVANGRLLEFQGGDVKNWKDTGPAPADAPPGIFIPQPVAPAIRPRP